MDQKLHLQTPEELFIDATKSSKKKKEKKSKILIKSSSGVVKREAKSYVVI